MNGRQIDWNSGDGLVPAIVQDARSGAVLMLGYMNREAFELTRSTGRVTFFSRSKQRLWEKGETTGHTLDVQDIVRKLDKDATPALRRLPEIAQQLQDAVTKANRLIGSVDKGYGDQSKFHRDLDRLIPQLTDAARSIRALSDLLTRHPEALIQGRTNTGKE